MMLQLGHMAKHPPSMIPFTQVLQNQLWSVIVPVRFHLVLTTGDMKQAFLQVMICMQDHDAMWFHWIAELDTRRVETLRFTRALFGLSSLPFLLGEVIKQHLKNCLWWPVAMRTAPVAISMVMWPHKICFASWTCFRLEPIFLASFWLNEACWNPIFSHYEQVLSLFIPRW